MLLAMTRPHPLAESRLPVLLLMLASAGTLLAALFFQYVVGLQPCVLCIWQRWPYVAVLALGLVALAVGRNARARAALVGLMGVALVVGAGVAVFHVGVEQHWWTGTSGCGVTGSADSLEALRAQVLAAPVTRCDEIAWSLLGVSMAGWNALIAAGLGVAAFAFAARSWRAAR